MTSYAFISLLATIASFANAMALPADAGTLVVTQAYLCTDINLSGNCAWYTLNAQSTCFSLEDTAFDNEVNSIHVENGYRCRLWDSHACNGDSTQDIYAPGINDLAAYGMDNKAGSFKCYQN